MISHLARRETGRMSLYSSIGEFNAYQDECSGYVEHMDLYSTMNDISSAEKSMLYSSVLEVPPPIDSSGVW